MQLCMRISAYMQASLELRHLQQARPIKRLSTVALCVQCAVGTSCNDNHIDVSRGHTVRTGTLTHLA
jgi:hypothetical protein